MGAKQLHRAAEHPRIRGENTLPNPKQLRRCGTSPHTRGKPRVRLMFQQFLGNIPAYAGKTNYFGSVVAEMEEHPRIRGENPRQTPPRRPPRGTSPHTRGKPHSTLRWPAGRRNIPAYAGKTVWRGKIWVKIQEHPRIRGENAGNAFAAGGGEGTSPHTRGKLFHEWIGSMSSRNIPAYAGKTHPVHP